MKKIQSVQDIFLNELKDVYSAEKQLTRALQKMAKKASDEKLAQGFQKHLEQTKEQIARLEKIFQKLKVNASRVQKCKGMEGILAEGEENLQQEVDEALRDVLLISAAQRAEHYEISAYGTVRTLAEQLGDKEAAKLLQQTLDEEMEMDKQLTEVATSSVNPRAQQAGASAKG
ncbi:MAG: ferritin-like domain-containing protein [Verrucomicrobia bacterium]|nr:ferritin-like domain-containing protein [Verrucomicrobiota bacterium]